PQRSVEENARAISDALARVRTGSVAPAARDDPDGRFRRGQAVGFVEEEVLAWGDPAYTLAAVLARLAAADSGQAPELISVLAGEDPPLELAEVQRIAGDGVELELRQGGQPSYWWLLAAEEQGRAAAFAPGHDHGDRARPQTGP